VKRIIIWIVVILIVIGIGVAGYAQFRKSKEAVNAKYRTAAAHRGEITLYINSTGNIKPVRSVQVGSFVSGPIQEVFVDFNDRVTAGQKMAQVDPRLYKAAVAHEEASLARAKADVERIKALLLQAVRNEERGKKLHATKAITETDMDLYIAEKASLEAQLLVAEASIRESDANLYTARTNLEFTDITAPVDGIVTDRKIDPGQTVAAQFQTPTLFVVAPDLEKKVYVYASVDEADIGLIRQAKERDEPVTFAVDAYPNDVFDGKIYQVRLNPTTVQNVVTFTVVVEAKNPELKLLPDMTANLTFQIEKKPDVLMIPNAALRFKPKPEQVRPEDRKILEEVEIASLIDLKGNVNGTQEKGDKTKIRSRNHKYVWAVDGEFLAPVSIVIGLSDKTSTEVLSGDLANGLEVVIGTIN
jgi:HlyD family secretion protein